MTPRRPIGTSVSTAPVTSRYDRIDTSPAIAIAGPRSRRTSRISSPIVDASSSPTSALHITAKLVVISHVAGVHAGAWDPPPRVHDRGSRQHEPDAHERAGATDV